MKKEYVFTEKNPYSLRGKKLKPIKYIINNGCWECVSHYKDRDGYPQIARNNKPMSTMSRHIYEETFGYISDELVVRHRCDNPSCINPSHLVLGTYKDNKNDSVRKSRHAYGEKQGNAKITENIVKEIRSIGFKLTQKEIAKLYNISETTVWRIRNNLSWIHV